ncbi:MAG: energy transducer TonB [Gemmatimonadales bacterium]
MRRVIGLGLGLAVAACHRGAAAADAVVPAKLLGQPAIPYPPDLFARRIEGNVLLYVVVDSEGSVLRDSTRIAGSSGQAAFDSAALVAAPALRFAPARRGRAAMTAAIQVPIRFTLPDSLRSARGSP